MRLEDLHNARRDRRSWGAPKVLREPVILEERRGVGDVQPAVEAVGVARLAAVDEEDVGEGRLGVGGEVARGGEVELGVLGDGLLVAPVAELLCDGEVVVAVSVRVAVLEVLRTGGRCMSASYHAH